MFFSEPVGKAWEVAIANVDSIALQCASARKVQIQTINLVSFPLPWSQYLILRCQLNKYKLQLEEKRGLIYIGTFLYLGVIISYSFETKM